MDGRVFDGRWCISADSALPGRLPVPPPPSTQALHLGHGVGLAANLCPGVASRCLGPSQTRRARSGVSGTGGGGFTAPRPPSPPPPPPPPPPPRGDGSGERLAATRSGEVTLTRAREGGHCRRRRGVAATAGGGEGAEGRCGGGGGASAAGPRAAAREGGVAAAAVATAAVASPPLAGGDDASGGGGGDGSERERRWRQCASSAVAGRRCSGGGTGDALGPSAGKGDRTPAGWRTGLAAAAGAPHYLGGGRPVRRGGAPNTAAHVWGRGSVWRVCLCTQTFEAGGGRRRGSGSWWSPLSPPAPPPLICPSGLPFFSLFATSATVLRAGGVHCRGAVCRGCRPVRGAAQIGHGPRLLPPPPPSHGTGHSAGRTTHTPAGQPRMGDRGEETPAPRRQRPCRHGGGRPSAPPAAPAPAPPHTGTDACLCQHTGRGGAAWRPFPFCPAPPVSPLRPARAAASRGGRASAARPAGWSPSGTQKQRLPPPPPPPRSQRHPRPHSAEGARRWGKEDRKKEVTDHLCTRKKDARVPDPCNVATHVRSLPARSLKTGGTLPPPVATPSWRARRSPPCRRRRQSGGQATPLWVLHSDNAPVGRAGTSTHGRSHLGACALAGRQLDAFAAVGRRTP